MRIKYAQLNANITRYIEVTAARFDRATDASDALLPAALRARGAQIYYTPRMLISLLVTAFLMGVAGGPHCVAMCGAACGAMQAQPTQRSVVIRVVEVVPWSFYVGRLIGYSLLGMLAASSLRGLAWLSTQSSIFQPLWTFSHTLIFAWGLLLLITGQQPRWALQSGQRLWALVKGRTHHARLGYFMTGMVWALLPCGLLYSAVFFASLQTHWLQGGLVMAAFALGSASVLAMAPLIWQQGQQQLPRWFSEAAGIRISGLLLIAISLVAIWMGVVHHDKFWCQVV